MNDDDAWTGRQALSCAPCRAPDPANCCADEGSTGAGGRNADGVAGPDIRCKDTGDFGEVLARGEERMPAFPTLAGGTAGELAAFVHQFCTGGFER